MATEGRKVIKAGIGYTIGNYLMKGLNFFTIPLFAYLLTKGDYGKFGTFGAYEGILYVILGAAIHTSYKNARYKYRLTEEGVAEGDDYYTYVSDTMIFILMSMTVLLIAANVFSRWLTVWLKLDLLSLNLLVIYCAATAIIACFNMDTSLNYGYGKYLLVAMLTAVSSIGLTLLLIWKVFPENGYLCRVIGTVASNAIAAAVIVIYFLHRMSPKQFVSRMKWGLKYSLPIVPHGISQVILNLFDRIMIQQMIGDASAGVYNFAYNVYTIIQVTANSIDTVWSPWYYEHRQEDDFKGIRDYSILFILLLFAICSMVMLLSPELVLILGRQKYAEAEFCAIPIAAAGYFAYLYLLPASVEYYHAKTKSIAAATMSAAALNIVMNYFCIRHFGYVAAAYTTLVTYILYFLFHYVTAWLLEKRCMFANMHLLISCAGILAVMAFSLAMIHQRIIRIGFAIVLFAAILFYEEKRFHGIRAYLKKGKKKNETADAS